MNSRRRILKSFPWIKEAYRGEGCKGTGFALQPGLLHCVSPEVCRCYEADEGPPKCSLTLLRPDLSKEDVK